MNSSDINLILKSLKSVDKIFVGVFASDTLPTIIKRKPALLICNTQPIRKPGEHWIAIYIDKHNFGEYFDSFGLPPHNIYISKFLKRNCVKTKCNRKMIQSLFSNYCGHFCIMYSYYKAMNKSLEAYVKIFNNKNLPVNNSIVINFLNVKVCSDNKACMNIFKTYLSGVFILHYSFQY